MVSILSGLRRWLMQEQRSGGRTGRSEGAGSRSARGALSGPDDEWPEDNRDTQAARHYHDGTKHPYGSLMDAGHFFDPATQPLLFKRYIGLESIPLPLDKSPLGVPALEAIASGPAPTGEPRIPDIGTLARLLSFSAGITRRIRYPEPVGEIAFRAAACTGALYHIELYVVCGDLPGLEAGVYHFDPEALALRRLRAGDERGVLVAATAHEPSVAQAPAILVYTDVFWRNAVKYQAREYRHAFWDSGTILANTLAMASAHEMPAKVAAGFVDTAVNRLPGLDTHREFALELVPIGYAPGTPPEPAPEVAPLELKTVPIARYEGDEPAIRAMHAASSLTDEEQVAAWRSSLPPRPMPVPSGRLFPLAPDPVEEMPQEPLESVILRRGSARQFSHGSISFRQLSTILDRALRGVPADFLDPGGTLNQVYLIVNAVDGLPPGTYVFHRDRQAFELLQEGHFRAAAGTLGLHQKLAYDASVNLFFLSDLKPILERFGNRGYRVAQLDASISAGRVYLAAEAQGPGATGLTFFDDAVTEFFSPHARSKSVMFLIALGKRPRRHGR